MEILFGNLPSLFTFKKEGKEFTKVSNAFAIDERGKDAVFALHDKIVPGVRVRASLIDAPIQLRRVV